MICGNCPRIWLVPLLLSEHEVKVKVVPSGHFTLLRPPSPFRVRGPWFLKRTAYFIPSWKIQRKKTRFVISQIYYPQGRSNLHNKQNLLKLVIQIKYVNNYLLVDWSKLLVYNFKRLTVYPSYEKRKVVIEVLLLL